MGVEDVVAEVGDGGSFTTAAGGFAEEVEEHEEAVGRL